MPPGTGIRAKIAGTETVEVQEPDTGESVVHRLEWAGPQPDTSVALIIPMIDD
jgi:hypothetical protein